MALIQFCSLPLTFIVHTTHLIILCLPLSLFLSLSLPFSYHVQRFLFEAVNCYLPLFMLAFYDLNTGNGEKDSSPLFITKDWDNRLIYLFLEGYLRLELSALYTTDSLRRVVTETMIPLVMLNGKRFFQSVFRSTYFVRRERERRKILRERERGRREKIGERKGVRRKEWAYQRRIWVYD